MKVVNLVNEMNFLKHGQGLFITGTDTGVGKTVVTAAIAALLAESGRQVSVYKPIQTGVVGNAPDDLSFVRAAVNNESFLCTGCSYRLEAPLAPAIAAKLEDVEIEPEKLVNHYRDLASSADVTLVEGAGGLLVPIREGYLMSELARDLNLPLLVVTRPGLGTLNHTFLTIEAARQRGLNVAGVVISGFPKIPDLAEQTNPEVLVRLTGTSLLGVFPWLHELSVEGLQPGSLARMAEEALVPALGGCFDPRIFLCELDDRAGLSSNS